MADNFYGRMYGPQASTKPTTQLIAPDKLATRVLGGMKAQNSHTKTVDVNGEMVSFPRAEYVKVLEDQIKQMRVNVREMQNNQQRLIREINKLNDIIRTVQAELKNKVDLR